MVNTLRPVSKGFFEQFKVLILFYIPLNILQRYTLHKHEIDNLLQHLQTKVLLQYYNLLICAVNLAKEYLNTLNYKDIYLYIQKVNYPQWLKYKKVREEATKCEIVSDLLFKINLGKKSNMYMGPFQVLVPERFKLVFLNCSHTHCSNIIKEHGKPI